MPDFLRILVLRGSTLPSLALGWLGRIRVLGRMLTTLRVLEDGAVEEIFLDQPKVTYLPAMGIEVEFRGTPAIRKRRMERRTTGGNLSVVLEVERQWPIMGVLSYFLATRRNVA